MTSSRKKILFFAEDVTLAHVGRPLLLAGALPPDQYEVHFAVSDRSAHFARAAGIPEIHSIQTIPPQQFLDGLAKGKTPHSRKVLHSYIREEKALIQKIAPDLVIGDFRLSLPISAKLCGVPSASLINFHWSPFAQLAETPMPDRSRTPLILLPQSPARGIYRLLRPFFFQAFLRPFNQVRRDLGLHPVSTLQEAYCSGDQVLYTDIPGWFPSLPLPSNHRMIGPAIWEPSIPTPPWWNDPSPEQKTVYLSLGSSGQIRLLPEIIDELTRLPIQLLVSTAGRVAPEQWASLSQRGNLWIHPYLPGTLAARRSDLVICNGGASTAYQALAGGVPILGIPSNLDQHLTMIPPVARGAARMIRSDDFSRNDLRQAVREILENGSFRASAQGIAADFRKYPTQQLFLEWLNTSLSQGAF